MIGIIINQLRKQNHNDLNTLKDAAVSLELCKDVPQQISGIKYESDSMQTIVDNFEKIKASARNSCKPSHSRWDAIRYK